jgi:hypothetical protein
VDGFVFLVALPAIVSVRKAAVVNEARYGVDAADRRTGSTRQSIRLEDTAKRVPPWRVVVKGQELALRRFGHDFQLYHKQPFQFFAWLGFNCEKRLLAQNASAARYIKAGEEAFAFPRDILDFEERDIEFFEGIGAVNELSNTSGHLGFVWLYVVFKRCQGAGMLSNKGMTNLFIRPD